MQSTEINELAQALVSAQAEFSAVPKGSTNPFFKSKYAALPDVVSHTAPVLAKHGLAVTQFITYTEQGDDALLTQLLHKSGQFIGYTMKLHLPKSDPQGQGSAVTYARRYSYMSVLGLVADEDDDGNKASQPKTAPKVKEPTALDNMRDLLSKKFEAPAERKKYVEGLMGRELKSLNDLSSAEIAGVILELS
jgi:hypothetical protein